MNVVYNLVSERDSGHDEWQSSRQKISSKRQCRPDKKRRWPVAKNGVHRRRNKHYGC